VHATDKIFWNLGLCVRVNGTMPAEKCVNVVDAKLKIYNISLDYDVVAITTDGASVMKKVGKIINADQQICLAHGIQLAILEVLYNRQIEQRYFEEIEKKSEREVSNLKDIDENDEVDSENDEDLGLQIHNEEREINDEICLNEIIGPLIEKN